MHIRHFIFSSALGLPLALNAAVPAPAITLTGPTDYRAVVGQTVESDFAITNTDAVQTDFDLYYTNDDPVIENASATPGTASGSFVKLTQSDGIGGSVSTTLATGTPWLGASLDASYGGTLKVSTDLSNNVAGDFVTVGVTALAPGQTLGVGASVSGSTTINTVTNRLLTGSTTIDAGRHMVGLQPVGAVTLNGGAQSDAEATRIDVNAGGYAQFTNGLRLSSTTAMTFDSANETHDLDVAYNGPTGAYDINTTLPGAGEGTYDDVAGDEQQDFGGTWDSTAEYGNVFGDTREFDELSGSWPYTTNGLPNNSLVETDQPVFDETRSYTNPTGVTTQWELERGAGAIINERVDPLMSGEVIQGSSMDLSGVTVNVSGTAVADREVFVGDKDTKLDDTISLGRRMVGADSVVIGQVDTVTLKTQLGHDRRTDLTLGAFDLTDGTVSASLASGVLFNEATDTATVNLAANFTVTTDVQGRNTKVIDVGTNFTGEGLAGEDAQSSMVVGYHWNNVLDNELYADDLLIIEFEGVSGLRNYSTYAGLVHSTETHTAIGVSGNSVAVNGTYGAGETNLGNTEVTAIAEGLVGETVDSPESFNTKLVTVSHASSSVSHDASGELLTNGNVLTVADTGSGIYQNDTFITSVSISGSENIDYQLTYGGGSTVIDHGSSRTFEIDYVGDSSAVQAGELGRVSKAELVVNLSEELNYSEITSGFSGRVWDYYNYLNYPTESFTYNLETRFDAPAATTGSATIEAGSDFGVAGVTLGNTTGNTSDRFVKETSVELLDSETLSGGDVTLSFVKLADAVAGSVAALESAGSNTASVAGMLGGAAATTEFVSDIVQLSGLDGFQHVIEISFDDSNLDGSEGAAQVIWSTTYGDPAMVAWVNAVLGNSNISSLDLLAGTLTVNSGLGAGSSTIEEYLSLTRFAGSYEAYLADGSLTDPELGMWGVDLTTSQAWAVIDHNSEFAVAVPEPAACALIGGILALTATMVRRRR